MTDSKDKWVYGTGVLVGTASFALWGWFVGTVAGVIMLAWSLYQMVQEINGEK